VTKPVSVSGHVDTTVTCTTASHRYTASASGALVAGYHVSFTVRVTPYHGPATYPAALVTFTLQGPSGSVGVADVPAPVTVTGTGGAFSLDTTTGSGQTLAVSVDWECS
jgi:hypothetical protein